MASTVAEVVDRAARALEALAEVGYAVEDEWQYVTDLGSAWRARLANVAAQRGREPVSDEVDLAVARAIDEAARISDPHRAIDWLSTLPQVVLLALGEPT